MSSARRCLVVDRRDRRLELVRPDHPERQGRGDQVDALADRGRIPSRAVLLRERHEAPVGPGPGRTARVGQKHECQQTGHLGVPGESPMDVAGDPDRLRGELRPLEVVPG